jgi:hypothetical protein
MKHILFAGLPLHWTREYADSFSKYLREIGYLTRVVQLGDSAVVAYSYRTFSSDEAGEALVALLDESCTAEGEIDDAAE